MTFRPKTLLIALLTLTVAFAGCTGEELEGDSVIDPGTDPTEVDLGDRGAIKGLVVDDNYRPVQLKEDWGAGGPGDFQDIGFVLILETAQRLSTTENGEFLALPLEPGTYTIRVAADNHEAIEKTVTVTAGEFAEVTLEARRTFSAGGTTLSQEYVMFIACSATAATAGAAGAFCGDLSGDSQRASFDTTTLVSISEDIRAMVTEMRAQQDGYYTLTVRNNDGGCADHDSINGCVYSERGAEPGVYTHSVNYPQLQWIDGDSYLEEGQEGYCMPEQADLANPDGCGRYFAMDFDLPFRTVLFPDHASRLYTDQAIDTVNTVTGPQGVSFNYQSYGLTLGVKAQVLQTVFLYELPEAGVADYCALCDDADIPE